MSKGERNCYFNNQMIVKIELEENGHKSSDWKICKEISIFGFTIRPRRIESFGTTYTDFEKFLKRNKDVFINEEDVIIVKPSVMVEYLGGWQYRIEKYFDTYEEAKKYSTKMLTKESTSWENIEY